MTDETRRPSDGGSEGRQRSERAGGIGANGISPHRHGSTYAYPRGMFDRWCEHRDRVNGWRDREVIR